MTNSATTVRRCTAILPHTPTKKCTRMVTVIVGDPKPARCWQHANTAARDAALAAHVRHAQRVGNEGAAREQARRESNNAKRAARDAWLLKQSTDYLNKLVKEHLEDHDPSTSARYEMVFISRELGRREDAAIKQQHLDSKPTPLSNSMADAFARRDQNRRKR